MPEREPIEIKTEVGEYFVVETPRGESKIFPASLKIDGKEHILVSEYHKPQEVHIIWIEDRIMEIPSD